MAAVAPPNGPPTFKPITLEPKFGPAPSLKAKFKRPETMVSMYRAYEWTQGHNVNRIELGGDVVAVQCPHPNCTYNVAIQLKTFTVLGKSQGQRGYAPIVATFSPSHNHTAPYMPLSLASENRRLSLLPSSSVPTISAYPSPAPPPTLRAHTEITAFLFGVNPGIAPYLEHLDEYGWSDPSLSLKELCGLEGDGQLRELWSDKVPLFVRLEIETALSRERERREGKRTEQDDEFERKVESAVWAKLSSAEMKS